MHFECDLLFCKTKAKYLRKLVLNIFVGLLGMLKIL